MAKIIPILLALAPSLLGDGYHPQHIPQHIWNEVIDDHRNISRFSLPTIKDKMSLYGYGYAYPKARRVIHPADYPRYAKAAIFNKALADTNPWIQFLRENKYYEQIGNLLREAKAKYMKSDKYDPVKSAKSRSARLAKAMKEYNIISQYAKQNEALFNQKFKDKPVKFDNIVKAKLAKLSNEIKQLSTALLPEEELPAEEIVLA